MNWLNKIFELVGKQNIFLKNIFILIVITRLLFLEDNQLALIAEIIGGIIVLVINKAECSIED